MQPARGRGSKCLTVRAESLVRRMLPARRMNRDPSLSSPDMARALAGQDPPIDIDLKGLKNALVGWGIGVVLLLVLLCRGVGGTSPRPVGVAPAQPSSPSAPAR